MSGSTVSAAFTAMGASSTAASVASAVYTSAVIGALVGAATSMMSGGDVMDGAMKGALIGGVTGGISKYSSETSAVQPVTTGEAGTQAVDLDTGQTTMLPPEQTNIQTAPTENRGLLQKTTDWVQKNPQSAQILSQTVGGAAKAIMDKKQRDEELQYLMERDRLNRNVNKINLKGLEGGTVAPEIGEFTQRPKWELGNAGLFEKRR